MTSSTRIILRLLPLGIVLLIATVLYIIYYSSSNSEYTDNVEENDVKLEALRHRRAIKPATMYYCKLNQYYDQEEGRCLGVPGGGKVLHIENGRLCGVNILKPHCTSSLYYHICKRDKSILAQCANRQIFNERLQRCVYYDSSELISSTIRPDDLKFYDHIRLPNCTRPGRFPVPGHCSMFFSCDTNGHRLYQSVFKCPQNTGYQADRGTCAVVPDCKNEDSVDSTVCVPNAPDENVETLNPDEITEENVESISGIPEETTSVNDVTEKMEENVDKIYDDAISSNPVSVIDNPLSTDEHNDSDRDSALSSNANLPPTQPVEDISVPDDIGETTPSQTPIENAREAFDEIQNEKSESVSSLEITSPSTAELDNDAPHSITTPVTSMEPEYRTNVDSETIDTAPSSSVDYTLSELGEGTQDVTTIQYRNDDGTVTPVNSNTEAIDSYLTSTISNIPEPSSISDTLLKLDKRMQDVTTEQYRNEDDGTLPYPNTEAIGQDLTSTVRNIPESSLISDMSPKIDEEREDVTTEQYRNNDDETVTSSSNTEIDQDPALTNIPRSSISDTSKIDEETQDVITEQYQNNEDSTLPNFNTEVTDLYSTSTVSNVPEPSLISDMSPKIDEKREDVTTEQYRNNDDEIVTLSSSNTETTLKLDKRMQDATTEQYNNEDDGTLPYSNTEAIGQDLTSTVRNIPESSLINDTSLKIDEETQNASETEQYKNNEDETITLPNSSNEMVDQNSKSTLNDAPATTDSLNNNDFDASSVTSAPTTLSPQTADDDQRTAKELDEASPSIDKLTDVDLHSSDGIESISTSYPPEHTDDLDLTPTTESTLILEHTAAPTDIAITTPTMQELPASSDTNLAMENDEQGTEVPPVFSTEPDAPATDRYIS